MADPVQLAFRLLHIGSAVILLGGGTLWALVVMPQLGRLAPTLPKGAVPTLLAPVSKVMLAAGLVTLLSGAATLWALGGFEPLLARSTWGMMLHASFGLMTLFVALQWFVLLPLAKRMSTAMSAAGPPGPEVALLRRRMMGLSHGMLAINWTIAILMVAAVSVRTA